MMSLPSASGELFSSFIVSLHTTHLMRSISGLLSSLLAVLTSPSPSARSRPGGGWDHIFHDRSLRRIHDLFDAISLTADTRQHEDNDRQNKPRLISQSAGHLY